MKLLHTSDWHLGMPLGTDYYTAEQKYFLQQLYDIVKNENIGAVLCAGDVYDSSVTNSAAISLYNDAVTRICGDMKIPMVIISGNHDSGARLASCKELLKGSGLFVSGKLTRDIQPVLFEGGRVAVYPIPFFNKDEVLALFPEENENIYSLETAYNVLLNHIRKSMDQTAVNIVVAHALIVNAEISDSDRAARVGFASAVSKEVFNGFDYIALGHIHKPQIISDNIRYSGSPIKYSFGAEEKHEKCVVIIDTEDMSQKIIPLKMLHDRKSICGTFEEIMATTGIEDCYLRIEVTNEFAGPQLYSNLKERFPLLLELKGKGFEETGDGSSLTAEELERLDEMGIMKKYMEETFAYSPNERQVELFNTALQRSESEADIT